VVLGRPQKDHASLTRDRGSSNFSGPPEAHTYPAGLNEHRHLPRTLGEAQHLFQGLGIVHHVPIHDLQPFLGLGLPGPGGEGSTLLAEDGHFAGHHVPLYPASRKKTLRYRKSTMFRITRGFSERVYCTPSKRWLTFSFTCCMNFWESWGFWGQARCRKV